VNELYGTLHPRWSRWSRERRRLWRRRLLPSRPNRVRWGP